MYAPRFDTTILAVLNVTAIMGFVAVVGLLVWSWRNGRSPQWRDLLVLVHFSAFGLYLPVFPLIWIAMERSANRLPDGTVRFPFGVQTASGSDRSMSDRPEVRLPSDSTRRVSNGLRAAAHLGWLVLPVVVPAAIMRTAAHERDRAELRDAVVFQSMLIAAALLWTGLYLGGATTGGTWLVGHVGLAAVTLGQTGWAAACALRDQSARYLLRLPL